MSVKYLSETRGEVQRDSTTFQEAAGQATWGGIDGNIGDQADLQTAINAAKGVGAGQTRHVFTSPERQPGVTYTNTTDQAIEVTVYDKPNAATGWHIALEINGVASKAFGGGGSAIIARVTVQGIVLPGETYRVFNAIDVQRWEEVRT